MESKNQKNKQKSEITTIKVTLGTKKRLEHLRESEGESYDSIINKAVNILNICIKNPMLGNKILRDIGMAKKRANLIKNSSMLNSKKINQEYNQETREERKESE